MLRRMDRTRFLSDEELERFMCAVRTRHHVNQPRDHALFALLANTGIRPSEARNLDASDVHAHSRRPWIHVRREKRGQSPDPIERLPIHRSVARVVARHVDRIGSGKLFPFSRRQSYRLFKFYARRAGLARHLQIFALRHTVGMRLWRHTHDLRMIQGIMGHARTKAASMYIHVAPERLRAARERIGTAL